MFGVQTTVWSFRPLSKEPPYFRACKFEEDQNNAASSHLPLNSAPWIVCVFGTKTDDGAW